MAYSLFSTKAVFMLFYSKTHISLSRIDLCLCTSSVVPLLEDIQYGVWGISDHSPILVFLNTKPTTSLLWAPWKLNAFWMSLITTHDKIATLISAFWQGHSHHPQLLYALHKAPMVIPLKMFCIINSIFLWLTRPPQVNSAVIACWGSSYNWAIESENVLRVFNTGLLCSNSWWAQIVVPRVTGRSQTPSLFLQVRMFLVLM